MPITPLLRCRHRDETREFYRSILGFSVTETAGETLTVEKEGGRLIFSDGEFLGPPAFSGTMYFTLADTDAFYDRVRGKAQIVWPLQDMPYGSREFGLRDCNSYCLAFRQDATRTFELADTRRRLQVRNADLSGSSLTDVKLEDATFTDINLRQARFSNVNLTGASIADANLTGMTIDGVLVTDLFAAYNTRSP